MKKFSILLLCAVVLFAGCGKSADTAGQDFSPLQMNAPTMDQTTLAEASEPSLASAEMQDAAPKVQAENLSAELQDSFISAVTEESKESIPADNGTVLFTLQLQSTTVTIPERPEAAAAINTKLHAKQAEERAFANELIATARADYEQTENPDEHWYGYSYYTTDTITRMDDAVFSLTTYSSSYTGGAHPNNVQEANNFDASSGLELRLSDVIVDEAQPKIEQMILEKLQENAENFGLFDDYESVITDKYHDSALEEQTNDWYFSDSGLVFFFNPYEISPYAAGVVKVEFPYAELEHVLVDAYLPEPQEQVIGGMMSIRFDSEPDLSLYSNIDQVPVDKEGQTIALSTNAVVYNVNLSLVTWVGNQPIIQRSLYTANRLSAQDLVIVRAYIPDTTPNLCLQFEGGDQVTQTFFISQNETDGTTVLLEEGETS